MGGLASKETGLPLQKTSEKWKITSNELAADKGQITALRWLQSWASAIRQSE